jgi:hypothetical protein
VAPGIRKLRSREKTRNEVSWVQNQDLVCLSRAVCPLIDLILLKVCRPARVFWEIAFFRL